MTPKKALYSILGLMVGGLVMWAAIRAMDWGTARLALQHLDWRGVALAAGALFFAWGLEACRWKLLLPGEKVSVRRLFFVRQAGAGFGNVVPGPLADLTETVMLAHTDGIKAPKVVSSIVLAHFLDLLVTINLVGAGLVLLPQLAGFRPVVLPLWGLTAAALLAFLLLARRISYLQPLRRIRFLHEVAQTLGMAHKRWHTLIACFTMTALFWMSIGLAAWLVGRAAGISLPFWLISIVIVAVIVFAGVVPAPAGAVGVYEFVAVSTLGLFAVDRQVAFAFALVTHALLILPSVLIGIPVLVLERRTFGGVVARAAQAISRTR